ncbi:LacI family DNA-binding transcriptional regulator [bacterium]|nr:LacI family DNA-binding transcriptional regulator [bacterium]
MKKITLKSIAEKAGVSPSTVSRVLKGDKNCFVSKRKKEIILEIVNKVGYTPNFAARNLALGRTSNIGFVLCSLSHLEEYGPFTFKLLEGIEKELKKQHYILSVVTITPQNLEELKKVCSSTHLYDGLIFASGVIPEKGVEIISKSPVPLIVLDDNSPFLKNISKVITDKQKGIDRAISYLRKLGHKKIAYYGFYSSSLEMFKKSLIKNNLTFDEEIVYSFSPENIYFLTFNSYLNSEKVLRNISKFTAIFCCNDFVALGLCQRLKEKGIKVGKDISVVGFDDIEELLNIPERKRFLTTVHKPREEMGKKVAELLLKMIKEGMRIPVEEKISCKVIIRHSTGPKN